MDSDIERVRRHDRDATDRPEVQGLAGWHGVRYSSIEDSYRFQCFAEDARNSGDDERVDLFEELAQQDRDLARRVKKIFAERLAAGA